MMCKMLEIFFFWCAIESANYNTEMKVRNEKSTENVAYLYRHHSIECYLIKVEFAEIFSL